MTKNKNQVWIKYVSPDSGRIHAETEMNVLEVVEGRWVTVSTRSLGEEITLTYSGKDYRCELLGMILVCDQTP